MRKHRVKKAQAYKWDAESFNACNIRISVEHQAERLFQYYERFLREDIKSPKQIQVLEELANQVLQAIGAETLYNSTSPGNHQKKFSNDPSEVDKLKDKCWEILFWCQKRLS